MYEPSVWEPVSGHRDSTSTLEEETVGDVMVVMVLGKLGHQTKSISHRIILLHHQVCLNHAYQCMGQEESGRTGITQPVYRTRFKAVVEFLYKEHHSLRQGTHMLALLRRCITYLLLDLIRKGCHAGQWCNETDLYVFCDVRKDTSNLTRARNF